MHKYEATGVIVFKHDDVSRFKLSTIAPSPAKARSNITYRLRKEYGWGILIRDLSIKEAEGQVRQLSLF